METPSSETEKQPRGLAAAFAGVVLVAAAIVCWPASDSTRGVQAVQTAVAFSIAAVGMALIARRRRISGVNLLLAIVTVAVCLAASEAALTIAGVAPLKRLVWRVPALADWWIVEGVPGGRIDGAKYRGPWRINTDGFPDSDSFNAVPAAPRRVLLLGDSFAFGARASTPDKIFPELLDRTLDATADTLVWNVSIPGTGQSSQYQLLREYLPRMDPQVVVCTLYRNDFAENLLPLDRFYVFEDGNWVDRYEGSELGRLRALSPEEAYRRAFAPRSASEYLKVSRTASAFAALVRRAFPGVPVVHNGAGTGTGPRYVATIKWFREILTLCESSRIRLIVLLVPDRIDLVRSSSEFSDAIRVVNDLGLTAIDVRQELSESDYAPPPDTHWNDHGHAAVAGAVAQDLEILWPQTRDSEPTP